MPTPDLPLMWISPLRREVMWRDGSSVSLHNLGDIALNGSQRPPLLFMRALAGLDQWQVFDLRQLSASLGDDLLRCDYGHHDAMVYRTLRLQYRTAAEFRRRVHDVSQWTLPAAEATVSCYRPLPNPQTT